MKPYFTVGELSKFSHLSKQTLIYYDKEDIFKPDRVDPDNGYRYYSAEKIEVLDSILILKEIGLSLKEIREFMEDRNIETAGRLLNQQKNRIDQNISHLQLVARRLQKKIESLQEASVKSGDKVYFEKQDREYLAAEKVKTPCGLVEVDIAMKNLLNRAGEESYPYYYQIGDMVHEENYNTGRYSRFDYAILPLFAPVKNCEMLIKPEGLYARCSHKGPYIEIGRTYERLLLSVTQNGYRTSGYAYEYCVLDSLTTGSEREYVTQVQIQIK